MELGLIGFGFLLGILGSAVGVVFQQVIVGHFRDYRLRRALVTEVEENLRRLNAANAAGRLATRVTSSAWDAARELEMSDPLRVLLADAYAAGDELNEMRLLLDATAAALAEAQNESLALERLGRMGTHVKDLGEVARKAFEKAHDALKER
jgi:hypothetical protein